jgi:two-component system NtrC family sensor kinase
MDKEQSKTRYYRSLLRNVVLTILLTAMTPTVIVSLFILDEFRSSYQKKVYDHLELLVRKHKKNIDLFLDEKLMDIRMLANMHSFAELREAATLNRKFDDLQRAFDRSFVDLGVVDHQGRQIAYAGPHDLTGVNYADTEWFQEAIRNSYFISDVFKGVRGVPHFIVTVRREHNGNPWILRATIDFGEFNNLVEYLRIGETGFAFILNRAGQFQTNPIASVKPAQLMALLKEIDLAERPQFISRKQIQDGTEVLLAITYLKKGDWIMVLQQEVQDAFADLRNAQRVALLIILIGALGIIATSLVMSQRLIRRISQADAEKAQADKEVDLMSQQVIETGKLASIGELAAGIAHEINNPVAIMIEEAGWVEDLLEEAPPATGENREELSRALQQIKTQGRRCKEITHKLLSFARKTDSRVMEISINALLDEIVYLSSQRAKYGNITITTRFEDGLPPIVASETEMQQVFLNLVNNALDAMEKTGGQIELATRRADQGIEISVADNGPGIAEANLARVFDPFYTTKPVGKGTGLGLSICYGIIKKIGGDIQAQSMKGQGTTFNISIPVTGATQGPPQAAPGRDTGTPATAT